ncbi:hypothetical protein M427DRAFT_57940 [Gonapodya prolifera JEL478]|uniref:Fimbrin n=1 Tax=Gonapodya prolifera (strain JEL478) TaxID=1344416 RepID=A0A139ABT5_GONPJ|nr:hypothetical protein M427DRAFT_57940 [Gonapodya prolifera JEL478]|eukprot:KXS14188.1 hypothetical protein M427DRAFT_57940 [Gonapodya prolifera JEL478]
MAAGDIRGLAREFNNIRESEIDLLQDQFRTLDLNRDGRLTETELKQALSRIGESSTDEIQGAGGRGVDFRGFLGILNNVRSHKVSRLGVTSTEKKVVTLGGSTEWSQHSFNEDEKESFAEHANQVLYGDKHAAKHLPIDTHTMDLFEKTKDGIILCKLINDAVPGTIDERVINAGKLNLYQMTENGNLVVNSAKAIGCKVTNIGAQDIIEGTPHLVLALIWQIVKQGLSAKIDIKIHPELFRLLEPGETLEQFLKLPAEQILLRWCNYHLSRAGSSKRVNNFTNDIKDSEAYTIILSQVAPGQCTRDPLRVNDLTQRAEATLSEAAKIGCRQYLTPKAIVAGNPRLNFAFTANLFNKYPGLEKLTEAEKGALDDALFDSEGDREARAFALWMNSLDVDPFVRNLYEDLQDGKVLLQVADKVHPGAVSWKRVNQNTTSKFKKVENANYAVELGKQFKYSLVGIQGSDIVDGNQMLTLALTWQLMRDNVIQVIKSLSKDGKEVTDNDIIKWANATVKRGAKSTSITNFKDPSLKTGLFLLDLLNGIKKGIVDYGLVTSGIKGEDAELNAKYAISLARKLGAAIFCSYEDIVEVKPKMIMTFVGSLWGVDRQLGQS